MPLSHTQTAPVKSMRQISNPGGGGGGVLPYNSYTGMWRPTGSHFWDSDLKRGIIFKPFLKNGV